MHDGIHKNAPVPKDWKSLIKACNQEVWKDRAPQKFEKIMFNLCKELKPIVEQAQALFSSQQACLKPSMEIEQLCYCAKTTLQENFVNTLERSLAHHSSQPLDQILYQACRSVIQENLDAHLRNIDGYLALNFPREQTEMNKRLCQTIESGNIEKQVKNLIAGIKLQSIRLPLLTLDEAIA